MTQQYFYFSKNTQRSSQTYQCTLELAEKTYHSYFTSAKATMGILRNGDDYRVRAAENFYRNLKRHSQELNIAYYHSNHDCVYDFDGADLTQWPEWVNMYVNCKLPNYPDTTWHELTNPALRVNYNRPPNYTTVYDEIAKTICDHDHAQDKSREIRHLAATSLLDAVDQLHPTPHLAQARLAAKHSTSKWEVFTLTGLPRDHYLNKIVCEMLSLLTEQHVYYWHNNWQEALEAADIYNPLIFDAVYLAVMNKKAPLYNKHTGHRDIIIKQ